MKKSVVCFVCFVLILFGCGKKSSNKSQNAKKNNQEISLVKITLKWPAERNKEKINFRRANKIPVKTESIKICVTGTNIKNSIESILNKDSVQNKEVELNIPVGIAIFKVTAFDNKNAEGNIIAGGEVVYNILPNMVNNVKIALEGYPKKIIITPESARIKKYDTLNFIANVYDIDDFLLANNNVKWGIRDNAIASVDSAGKVVGLNEGKTYVKASVDGLYDSSNLDVIVIEDIKNVSANAGNKQITLSWTSANGAVVYKIYYSALSCNFKNKLFLAETTDTTFVHKYLTNGKEYFYSIIPINIDLEGNYTNEKSAIPTDTFLYVACADSQLIEQFAVNKESGNLSTIGELFATVQSDYKIDKNMAISISKKMLYAISYDSNKIYEYSINETTGNLSLIANVKTGNKPKDIKISNAEDFIYVANYDDNNVSFYKILDNGQLIEWNNLSTGSGPCSIAINPLNSKLYIANYKSPYYIYKYNLNDFSYQGKIIAMKNINILLFSKLGNYIYAGSTDKELGVYSVNGDGGITLNKTYSYVSYLSALTSDSNGKYLYSTSYGSDYIISYSTDDMTGELALNEKISAGDGPQDIAISDDDRFVYIANSLDDNISIYGINSLNGKLMFVNNVDTKQKPAGLCLFSPLKDSQINIAIE